MKLTRASMKEWVRAQRTMPRRVRRMGVLPLVFLLGWADLGSSQTFSSGSTGADGAFAPAATTTVTLPPDGILNYTTVTIPAGVTVTFTRNAADTPVTLLATGDITVAGTIRVDGGPSTSARNKTPGGPGGFPGGLGGTPPTGGAGPGGGLSAADDLFGTNATYGVPAAFVSLTPPGLCQSSM